MKINCIPCMTCFSENGYPSEDLSTIELRDDDLYEITCKNGHTTCTRLQQCRFEILFEIGLHAFSDGYYDCAVSRFSTALERFYEFCIMIWLYAEGLNYEQVNESLKRVNLSERELGAFLIFYNIEKHKFPCFAFPTLLTEEDSKFRNNVIHKGHIPSYEKTEKFGNTIYEIMVFLLRHLKSNRSKELDLCVVHHQKRLLSKNNGSAIMTIPTAISICHSEQTNHSFLNIIQKLKNNKLGIVK